MDALYLRDVRCFKGPTTPSIRPITVLVGENSTGKSTFLACVRLAWDMGHGLRSLDFNEPPFALGAYDHVARFHGGRGQRAKSFKIGFSVQHSPSSAKKPKTSTRSRAERVLWRHLDDLKPLGEVSLIASFVSRHGQPYITNWDLSSDKIDSSLTIEQSGQRDSSVLRVQTSSDSFKVRIPSELPFFRPDRGMASLAELPYLLEYISRSITSGQQRFDFEGPHPQQEDLINVSAMARVISIGLGANRPLAFSPIRSEPERIYIPGRDEPIPSGKHAPFALLRMLSRPDEENRAFLDSLQEFGKTSGLFREIGIHPLGGKPQTDPFEVMVSIAGQATERNLADVGYGVSQSLPFLVDCLTSSNRTLLIQQPEVHLHPRAQAALGSFFVRAAKTNELRMLIETHSDYLLDRLLIEAREGHISHADITVLFFHQEARDVRIHQMDVDSTGNLINAPESYRQFFVSEQKRFIGI